MHLVNMDVNRSGANAPTHLGPFSPKLNAIYGPRGSGKTTLLHWLRQVAIADGRESLELDPSSRRGLGYRSASAEIVNHGRRYRVQLDEQGRCAWTEVVPPGHGLHPAHPIPHRSTYATPQSEVALLSARQRAVFLAVTNSLEHADTEEALRESAKRLELDAAVPIDRRYDREKLLARQQQLEQWLGNARAANSPTRESLLRRQSELEAELRRLKLTESVAPVSHAEKSSLDERYGLVERELRKALEDVENIDRQLVPLRSELASLAPVTAPVEISVSYRQQLQQIDERLNRWRQTLRELKAHRERIDHEATDARLDQQVGDQLARTKHPDPRDSLRSLEMQIQSARQQLAALAERYSVFQDRHATLTEYDIRRDNQGRTRISYTGEPAVEAGNLPDTLREMQRELYEACQQLARHESQTVSQTLKQQSQQLQRCEVELLHSVEKLVEERALLLRKIGDEYRLSGEQMALAFGDWCQCQDHQHLQHWLLHEPAIQTPRSSSAPVTRAGLTGKLEELEASHRAASLHAEDCRSRLLDLDVHRRTAANSSRADHSRLTTEIHRDLAAIQQQLNYLNESESWQEELKSVREQLITLGAPDTTHSTFRDSVKRHIAGLMDGARRVYERTCREGGERRYDLVDGIVYDKVAPVEIEVPAEIVRLAMRLAIVESSAARSAPVTLVLNASLDGVAAAIQDSAIDHLAKVAQSGQQVVLLTNDQRVAECVRTQQGWVGYLPAHRQMHVELDVNRQLTALANDYEADKWYQPQVQPDSNRGVPARGEFYLSERSLIEELPSSDPTVAARCRALGVDRVGDLLDVDPHWLAEHLRIDGVRGSTVATWQSEASLLCSVRQLRPFDARLLVGVGVRAPRQLGEMHPSELLDRVERFLATDRGRRILRSGTSYELSRIKAWIASAKRGAGRFQRSSFADEAVEPRHSRSPSVANERHPRTPLDYEERESDYTPSDAYAAEEGDEASGRRAPRTYSVVRRTGSDARQAERADRRERARDSEGKTRGKRTRRREALKLARTTSDQHASPRLRFHLELLSPIVDAPSIGPRMAARLEKIGLRTVEQLLAANPESLADKLDLSRVDATTIRAWQEQARLVCRIPNLRGHDAQLLVACDFTSPEELANMTAASVLSQVLQVAESSEGQRILRGGKQPDLEEVSDWIAWAANCRALNAA